MALVRKGAPGLVRDVLTGDKAGLKRDVLRRLNAAKGGGYIPMSDHSVPDKVPVEKTAAARGT